MSILFPVIGTCRFWGTVIVLLVAAFMDLKKHRIPNWLTGPAAIAGLSLWSLEWGVEGLRLSAIGLGVGFAAFIVPFALEGAGGGDVKLMAAVGALAGWPLVVWVILLSCVVALFGATARTIWQGTFWKACSAVWQLVTGAVVAIALRRPLAEFTGAGRMVSETRFPFGAAIAAGAAWAMLLRYLVDRGVVVNLPFS